MSLKFRPLILSVAKWVAGIVAVLAIGIFAFSYWYVKGYNFGVVEELSEAPNSGWKRVDLGLELRNGDGSRYYPFVRRGSSENLMIYFQGGGLSWDAETASKPMTTMSFATGLITGNMDDIGYYFGESFPYILLLVNGAFNFDHEENFFQDWTILYLPYSTGDFHLGRSATRYVGGDGEEFTTHHHGATNAQAALDWIYREFPNPGKVLVAGSSAGAAASSVWVIPVAENYSEASVYQLSDGAHMDSETVRRAANEFWLVESEEHFGMPMPKVIPEEFYLNQYATNSNNVIRYMHANTDFDQVLIVSHTQQGEFGDLAYEEAGELWSDLMKASVQRLEASDLPYSYYVSNFREKPDAEGTRHTMMFSDAIYEDSIDGVRFIDWLRANILDDAPLSAGASIVYGDDSGSSTVQPTSGKR